MSFWSKILDIFKKAESVLFSPEKCICCGREKMDEDSPFCDVCKNKIVFIEGRVCNKCGMPINAGNVCDYCKKEKFSFDVARAGVLYDENSSLMITKFKYNKAKYLAERLSDILVQTFAKYEELKCDVVTFVPMSAKKKKVREYNQTEELAKLFCEKTKLPLLEILLKKVDTKPQASLNRKERTENLKNTFGINSKIKKQIADKNILIIDDVFTTGSTASECARVLKKAGASGVFVLTIAKVKL